MTDRPLRSVAGLGAACLAWALAGGLAWAASPVELDPGRDEAPETDERAPDEGDDGASAPGGAEDGDVAGDDAHAPLAPAPDPEAAPGPAPGPDPAADPVSVAAETSPPVPDVDEPAGPAPVDRADREALRELAEGLPGHGVPPLALPGADAGDAAWIGVARELLEVFAPRSLRAAARRRLLEERPLAAPIARLVPRHRRYVALQQALVEAATLSARAPTHIRKPPYVVRLGVTAPEVASLRDRLLLEGYGDPAVQGRLREYWDERLKRALWQWQRDNGLPLTVVLDPLTRRRLNAPIPSQLAPVALALARWRALDLREDVGRHVLVHLNSYELVAEEDGREAIRMEVIVGKDTPDDATPALSAPLVTVVAHPDWRVPRRIVEQTLRPRAEGLPEVLEAEGYEVEVTRAGDWRVRRPPGPDNPLGELKFLLRGTDGIYLHDTNQKGLFGKSQQTFSAGCVRLRDPAALARWLLVERRAELDAALEGRAMTRFDLDWPIATHLVYQTVSVGADGRLVSHADIYGRDAAERESLALDGLLEALTAAAGQRGESVPSAR